MRSKQFQNSCEVSRPAGRPHISRGRRRWKLCAETGYEIVDCSYTPRANNLGRDATQRLLKLPRALFFAIHKDTAVRVLGGYSLLILAR
jgi:hypothetical protein